MSYRIKNKLVNVVCYIYGVEQLVDSIGVETCKQTGCFHAIFLSDLQEDKLQINIHFLKLNYYVTESYKGV